MIINSSNLNNSITQNYYPFNNNLINLLSIFMSNSELSSSQTKKENTSLSEILNVTTNTVSTNNTLREPTNKEEEKIYNTLKNWSPTNTIESGLKNVLQGNGVTHVDEEKPFLDGYNKAMETAKEHYNGIFSNSAPRDIDTAIQNKIQAKGQLVRHKQSELMTLIANLYNSDKNSDLANNKEVQNSLASIKSIKAESLSLTNEMTNKDYGESMAGTIDNIINSLENIIKKPESNPVYLNMKENGLFR